MDELTRYKRALWIAAEEAYRDEVVAPEMETLIIGPADEYATKKDWLEDRVEYWLSEAAHRKASV
jgi:hypothetical protein